MVGIHFFEPIYITMAKLSSATTPTCPSAIVQWQHGRVTQLSNGSLALTPIAIDGRQILSRPCIDSTTSLTRWNQSELFLRFEVLKDMYNGRMRLNLWQWDGTPVNPMWLAYNTPKMLPTTTLSAASQTPKTTLSSTNARWKARRDVHLVPVLEGQRTVGGVEMFSIGIGMMAFGAVLVIAF